MDAALDPESYDLKVYVSSITGNAEVFFYKRYTTLVR